MIYPFLNNHYDERQAIAAHFSNSKFQSPVSAHRKERERKQFQIQQKAWEGRRMEEMVKNFCANQRSMAWIKRKCISGCNCCHSSIRSLLFSSSSSSFHSSLILLLTSWKTMFSIFFTFADYWTILVIIIIIILVIESQITPLPSIL